MFLLQQAYTLAITQLPAVLPGTVFMKQILLPRTLAVH